MIGRIPVINLNVRQSELYFLRMLLYHKADATSFQDMRTFRGEMQATYQEVCKKTGLLDYESESDHSPPKTDYDTNALNDNLEKHNEDQQMVF